MFPLGGAPKDKKKLHRTTRGEGWDTIDVLRENKRNPLHTKMEAQNYMVTDYKGSKKRPSFG